MLTRRAVRPPTPLAGNFRDGWRFARRQYQLIRLYRPRLWCFAAFVASTDLAARIALISNVPAWGAALPVIFVLACLGSTATEIRLAIGRKMGVTDGAAFRLAQHLLVWTILPAPMFHVSVIWGGAITSPVVWRHVRYVVDKSGKVIDVARRPHSDTPV